MAGVVAAGCDRAVVGGETLPDDESGATAGVGGEASWSVPAGSGGCDTIVYEPPVSAGQHVAECVTLDHLTNPPTSGKHYPRWADYRSYDAPVPRGYLLHALEHGGVLFAYNCALLDAASCDALRIAIEDFQVAFAADPACEAPIEHRLLAAPDPELDAPFAAAAWGQMLKARCFDDARVGAFAKKHYGTGPEDSCAPGFDPTDPEQNVPADCGK